MNKFINLICLSIALIAPAHAMQNDANLGGRLLAAAKTGDHKRIEQLISARAPVDYADYDGMTALLHAANAGHLNCVQILIAAGAQVNRVNNTSVSTALMYAARNGHLPCVKALLAAGARVNRKNRSGWTTLICAIINDNQPICELVVDAMLWIPNQKQKTKIYIFMNCLKKQKAIWEIYRNRKDLFKNHLALVVHEQNRNDIANSIAYQKIEKLKDYPMKKVLLEKYNPGATKSESQSGCTVQ